MPLTLYTGPDDNAEHVHRIRVAACSLNLIDVDKTQPAYTARLASIRREVNSLLSEMQGPTVTYRRGSTIVHGLYIADLSTNDTVAIRRADGQVEQFSTVGHFDLTPRSVLARRAAAA